MSELIILMENIAPEDRVWLMDSHTDHKYRKVVGASSGIKYGRFRGGQYIVVKRIDAEALVATRAYRVVSQPKDVEGLSDAYLAERGVGGITPQSLYVKPEDDSIEKKEYSTPEFTEIPESTFQNPLEKIIDLRVIDGIGDRTALKFESLVDGDFTLMAALQLMLSTKRLEDNKIRADHIELVSNHLKELVR